MFVCTVLREAGVIDFAIRLLFLGMLIVGIAVLAAIGGLHG